MGIMTTLALALGAGGARGLAHIHALQALDDLGVKPVAIAGTSIGAILGAAYSAGMSGEEIRDYVEEKFRNRLRLIGNALKVRPQNVQAFLADGGLRFAEFNLERILDIFLPPQIPAEFAGLGIPLQVIATDYYGQCDHVFDTGPVRPTLAASAAMPAVFLPVKIGDRFYIDGGTTNPVPFDHLQRKADRIVSVDVSGGTYGDPMKRPAKIDAMYGSSQLMQQSIVRSRAERYKVDALIRPKVEQFRALDFLKANDVFAETKELRESFKRAVEVLLGPA
jgi:NTE family protein